MVTLSTGAGAMRLPAGLVSPVARRSVLGGGGGAGVAGAAGARLVMMTTRSMGGAGAGVGAGRARVAWRVCGRCGGSGSWWERSTRSGAPADCSRFTSVRGRRPRGFGGPSVGELEETSLICIPPSSSDVFPDSVADVEDSLETVRGGRGGRLAVDASDSASSSGTTVAEAAAGSRDSEGSR